MLEVTQRLHSAELDRHSSESQLTQLRGHRSEVVEPSCDKDQQRTDLCQVTAAALIVYNLLP